jgi:predicted PurR-regulated permease PerM
LKRFLPDGDETNQNWEMQEEQAENSRRSNLFRFNGILLALLLFFTVLYLAQALLIPFALGLLFAMLMTPFSRWLEKHWVPRWLAPLLCVLVLLAILGGLGYFVGTQAAQFTEDLPELLDKLKERVDEVQTFIQENLGIDRSEQNFGQENGFVGSAAGMAGQFVLGLFTTIFHFGLTLVYIYLLLLYRAQLKRFLIKAFRAENKEKTQAVIHETGKVAQHYLGGIFIVVNILAVLNTLALLLIGIEHPILFGVIAGYLNFIPFIGTFIGSMLPITMALLTEDTLTPALLVLAAFSFNQFLEETVLTPYFVGSKVDVNPLAVILAILGGNMLWGIPGVVIFIPLLAITKIIFDHVEPLRPFGFVLGRGQEEEKDAASVFANVKKWLKNKFR